MEEIDGGKVGTNVGATDGTIDGSTDGDTRMRKKNTLDGWMDG